MRILITAVLLFSACGGEPLGTETSAMTWTFTNNCLYPMNLHLFDLARGTKIGDVRVLTESTELLTVRCENLTQIAFGGATDGFPGELGAGDDGHRSCSNCAFICGASLPPQISLDCP